jgi:colanic acid/amylovoran biosynthesis glycosyltransferase
LKSSQETLSIISKANGVSTISEENIQYLKNEFKIPHDIHLYRLGIDIEKFFFKPINNSSQSKRLLYIGRFIEKKGIEYLLQSMANLKDHEIKFELHLFGEGPLKDRFDFLIVELSLEKHVFIHAKISQEDVVKEFHRSDLFIVPSIVDENNDRDVEATVIKEAMACGIPVITTDIPGNHSFIQHNVNGYIVAQKDSEALGAAIVHLSKSGIAESLVLKAREHMCKFYDLKKSCSLLNEFFEKVVRDFREDN